MPKALELANQRFGRFLAIEYAYSVKYQRVWKCRCDCGKIHFVEASQLRCGEIKSCGCSRVVHGLARSSTYKTWQAMKTRCEDISFRDYPLYGGRGIRVCKKWHNFINFFADMGERPTPKHSLERINNDKGYSPSNCKWATWDEQARNKRNNVKHTYKGVTKLILDWATEHGMSKGVLDWRLKKGWDFYRALNTPVATRKLKEVS